MKIWISWTSPIRLFPRCGRFHLDTFLVFVAILLLTNISSSYSDDRIVVVKTLTHPKMEQIAQGFNASCQDKFEIIEYNMEGNSKTFREIVSEIHKMQNKIPPKFILTIGDPATKLMQESVADIPIFFTMITNPIIKGFHGDGIGGISLDVPLSKQLEQLKVIIPIVKTVGIFYNPEHVEISRNAVQTADNMGLNLIEFKLSAESNLSDTINDATHKVDALIFLSDSSVINSDSLKTIVARTIANKIPTIVYSDYLIKQGFLLALDPNYSDIGKQAGKFLCRGSPDKVSIMTPEKVDLVINLDTAKRIGLNISSDITSSARVYN